MNVTMRRIAGSKGMWMNIFDFLSARFYGETFQNWLIAGGVLVGVILILQVIKQFLISQLVKLGKRRSADTENLLLVLLQRTSIFFIAAMGLSSAVLVLDLPEKSEAFVGTLAKAAFFFQIALWGNGLINYFVNRKTRAQLETTPASATSINAFGLIARVILWSVIVLLILENVTGIQVDTLIASLGITGVAVALAVQNILGDLFASLSIAMDQPFVIGDFIIVNEYSGSVEHIGLKSTRLRSITGEQLIFSNSDLLSSRIRNFKRMARRRMLLYVNVPYGTPGRKLQLVPEIIEQVVSWSADVTFERAHLMSLAEYSLRYEVVCYVETADYKVYMDRQQEILLGIYRRFDEEGIEFALQIPGAKYLEGFEQKT